MAGSVALEIRNIGVVRFHINHVADDQAEHQSFGKSPITREHAPDVTGPNCAKRSRMNSRSQASTPPQDYRFFLFALFFAKIAFQFSL